MYFIIYKRHAAFIITKHIAVFHKNIILTKLNEYLTINANLKNSGTQKTIDGSILSIVNFSNIGEGDLHQIRRQIYCLFRSLAELLIIWNWG